MPGSVDIERLVVSMEATITKFERAMAKSIQASEQTTRRIESRFEKMSKNINTTLGGIGKNAFGGFVRGVVGVLAPILTTTAAINGMKAALAEFGAVSDNAKAAGLDVEFFQGLTYQAQQAGVEFETLSSSLQTFSRNSGLAEAGTGRMVTALSKLNPALLLSIQNATTQEERVRLAAQALADAGSASEKAALAVALFGEAGPKLVDAFQDGAAGLDAMQAKARDLGLIVRRDLIARAEELGDEFDTVSKIVDLQLKQALVDLAPVIIAAVGLAGDLATAFGIVVDQFREIEARQFLRPMQNQLADTYNKMQPIKDRIAEIEDQLSQGGPNGMILKLDLSDAQAQLETLTAQADALLARITELQGRPTSTPAATPPDAVPPAGPTPEEMELTRKLFLYTNPDYTDRNQFPPSRPASPAARSGGSSGASDTIDQAEAVRDIIASLQEEQAQLGMTAAEQEYYNLLKRAGVTAESDFGQAILDQLTPLQEQRAAIEANTEIMSELGDIAGGVGRSLHDAFEDGQIEASEMLDIVIDIVKQLLTMPSIGGAGGGLGGIAGSFLSGLLGFASGTADTGGQRGQVRGVVHGREAVIPLPNGGKVPVDLRMPAMPQAAAPGPMKIMLGIATDSAGNITPYVESVVQSGVRTAAPHIVNAAVTQAGRQAPGAMAKYQQERAGSDHRVL